MWWIARGTFWWYGNATSADAVTGWACVCNKVIAYITGITACTDTWTACTGRSARLAIIRWLHVITIIAAKAIKWIGAGITSHFATYAVIHII